MNTLLIVFVLSMSNCVGIVHGQTSDHGHNSHHNISHLCQKRMYDTASCLQISPQGTPHYDTTSRLWYANISTANLGVGGAICYNQQVRNASGNVINLNREVDDLLGLHRLPYMHISEDQEDPMSGIGKILMYTNDVEKVKEVALEGLIRQRPSPPGCLNYNVTVIDFDSMQNIHTVQYSYMYTVPFSKACSDAIITCPSGSVAQWVIDADSNSFTNENYKTVCENHVCRPVKTYALGGSMYTQCIPQSTVFTNPEVDGYTCPLHSIRNEGGGCDECPDNTFSFDHKKCYDIMSDSSICREIISMHKAMCNGHEQMFLGDIIDVDCQHHGEVYITAKLQVGSTVPIVNLESSGSMSAAILESKVTAFEVHWPDMEDGKVNQRECCSRIVDEYSLPWNHDHCVYCNRESRLLNVDLGYEDALVSVFRISGPTTFEKSDTNNDDCLSKAEFVAGFMGTSTVQNKSDTYESIQRHYNISTNVCLEQKHLDEWVHEQRCSHTVISNHTVMLDSMSVASKYESCNCEKGTAHLQLGHVSYCSPCPLSTYKKVKGTHTCTRCPDHSTTSSNASVSADDCLCDIGFYKMHDISPDTYLPIYTCAHVTWDIFLNTLASVTFKNTIIGIFGNVSVVVGNQTGEIFKFSLILPHQENMSEDQIIQKLHPVLSSEMNVQPVRLRISLTYESIAGSRRLLQENPSIRANIEILPLSSDNVPQTTPVVVSDESNGIPMWGWVVIIMSCVLLLGGLIFYFLYWRPSKKDTTQNVTGGNYGYLQPADTVYCDCHGSCQG